MWRKLTDQHRVPTSFPSPDVTAWPHKRSCGRHFGTSVMFQNVVESPPSWVCLFHQQTGLDWDVQQSHMGVKFTCAHTFGHVLSVQLHSSITHLPFRFHPVFFESVCTWVYMWVCVCPLQAQVALMVGEEGEEMGSSFSVSALMWPSFESERSREAEMCFASIKQHLALKCSFSRELVAFIEVRSASQKHMRAAYLAGTHTHTHIHTHTAGW